MKTNRRINKALSVLLAFVMTVTALPIMALSTTAATAPVSSSGYWEHKQSSDYTDGRGENYITMHFTGVSFRFIQTQANEEFVANSMLTAYKNDGANTATINSVAFTCAQFSNANVSWNARTDLNSSTPSSPEGNKLAGSVGSGYENQKKNNAYYWESNYSFTSPGAGSYTVGVNINYKTGSTTLSTTTYNTDDSEPIALSIEIIDKSALVTAVTEAKAIVAAHPELTELAEFITNAESAGLTDSTTWVEQSQIDEAVSDISAELEGAYKILLNEKISEAEGYERKYYTDDSFSSLKTAISDAKSVAENSEATTEQVKNAISQLDTAINALVKTDVVGVTATEKDGSWVHTTDSDGKGINYVSMELSPVTFKFVQTEKDEKFKAVSTYWVFKNNGVNHVIISSVTFTGAQFSDGNVTWNARTDLDSDTPAAPSNVSLDGYIGSGYSNQKENNSYYWDAVYSFTSPGAGSYNVGVNINYKAGATTSTSKTYNTDDSEPITLTINIVDETELIETVKLAKELIAADSSLTELNTLVESAENAHMTDGTVWFEQTQIDEMNAKIIEAIKASLKAELTEAIENANSVATEDYTSDSVAALTEAVTNGTTTLNNEAASIEDLQNAIKNITDAMSALTPDKTELQNKVDELNKLDKSDYTEETYKALEEKINNAQTVLDNENATVEEIKTALEELNNATTNLVPDKTALQSKVDEANALDTTGYTEETVKALEEKIASAQAVLDNENATLEEVKQAQSDLENAMSALTPDKTELQNKVDELNKLDKSDYTEETYKALEEKINNAQTVLDNENATVEEIKTALEELNNATTNLVPDKTALQSKVDEANALDTTGYTEETVKSLEEKIASAQAVLDNENATLEEVKQAQSDLENAMSALTPDKTELQNKVDELNKLDKDSFTEESYKELEEKINNAQTVLDNPNATVEEIKKAQEDLSTAVDSLELIKIVEKADASVKIDRETEYTYMVGLTVGANSVSELKAQLENDGTQIIITRDDTVLGDSDYVGTGCVVKCVSVKDPSVVYEVATVILYGDVNGDGLVDETDSDMIMSDAFDATTLIASDSVYFIAADLSKDGVLDMFDYFYQDGIKTGNRTFDQSVTLYK